jgi:hypothetical protein
VATGFVAAASAAGTVWTVPVVLTSGAFPVVPLWSSEARCQAAIDASEAMVPYEPEAVPVATLVGELLPALAARGHRVGLDWTGRASSGPTSGAAELAAAFAARRPPRAVTVRSRRR